MAGSSTSIPAARGALCARPDVVNLNAGTCSPSSRPAEAEARAWREAAAADPVQTIFRDGPRRLETARLAVAAAFGGNARDLALFVNSSYAVNTVLGSLPWRAGDEILVPDQEYQHYWALLRRIAAAKELTLKVVRLPLATEREATPQELAATIVGEMTARTRLLLVSHVTSPTGLRLPVEVLCREARARGVWSFVDGAHAAGLVPLDLKRVDADFYTANLHKWVMNPVGAAFLQVGAAARRLVAPLMTFSYYEYEGGAADERIAPAAPSRWAMSHEYQGTRDLAAFAAVPAALAFHASIGLAAMTARWRELRAYACERLGALGYRRVSHDHPELATAMVAFAVPHGGDDGAGFDTVAAWAHMREKHGIEVLFANSIAGAPPVMRVSTAWFNTEQDVDRLVQALKGMDFREFVLGVV